MRVAVIGAGHNGLVAACYLARAGAEVVLLEQADKLGGGSRTDELTPGFHFNTHSAAHNLINATDIISDLKLPQAGLEYREMDPFSIAVFRNGTIVRFHRSIERTIASIAESDTAEARRYADWMHEAMPIITAMRAALESGDGRTQQLRRLPRRLHAGLQALARNGGPAGLAGMLLSPYGRVLRERLGNDLVRAPVSAFAAHASASPAEPGSALFSLWQAFYHQVGQWHAVGGSQGLINALARRLETYGGRWRTNAAVQRITRTGSRVTGVILESGERLPTDAVLTAIDPQTALLHLLDPPLDGPVADTLRAARRGNAVQMLVLLATTELPRYAHAQPGDWNGLQSYVDSVDSLEAGFAQANARHLPDDPVPTYAFTPSALDSSLAPPGHHTVYLACPTAPGRLRGGWEKAAPAFADRMVGTIETRAPGFTDTVVNRTIRTPEHMAHELRWPGPHPMHLGVSLDQLGLLRPTRALSAHTTPIRGLVISGAGTAPVGGIAGTPGRSAAHALLRSMRKA